MSEEKNRVVRLRRRAKSQRFTLYQYRVKNPKAPEYKKYQLVDITGVRSTASPKGFPWMTLDEVEQYLETEPGVWD